MAIPNAHPPEEDQKSEFRKIAEHKLKQQGKKAAKKAAKKALVKGAKLAITAVKQLGFVLVKTLLSLLAAIGIPTLLIVFGIMVLVIIVSLVSSYFFGTGEGLEGKSKELHEYIIEQADGTVDMSDPLQVPYRVPEMLIASVVQLEAMESEDHKAVIREMASALAPQFSYDNFNEWTETQTRVCTAGECEPWSKTKRTDNTVKKISSVDFWEGNTSFSYTAEKTDWQTTTETKTEEEEEVKTQTRTRRQWYSSEQTTTRDYAVLDGILNSYDLGMNDKRLIEANYLFAGGEMKYTEWLNGEDVSSGFNFGGYSGFNGTVTPGEGVPAQYMPHYLSAEKKYGVHWYTLAAVHYVETAFSTHPTMVSSVGAQGHMQFMPATWAGWTYNIGGGLVSSSVDITNLNVIRKGNGYGVDGNGDGKADPWDVEDAIHTAASYLAKSGYSQNQRKAVFNYNHASWYVDKVLANAEKFKNQATYQPAEGDAPTVTDGAFMRPATGRVTSGYGPRGGFHHGIDIGRGGRTGVPIVAAADGVVFRSYLSTTYGHCVMIRHNIGGRQFETVYGHMTHRSVSTGQQVKKGQFLGNMGNTGNTDGPHLHFEVHSPAWNGNKTNSKNPVQFVPF